MRVSPEPLTPAQDPPTMRWVPILVIAIAQMLIVGNSATLSLSVGGIVAEFNAPVAAVQTALVVYLLVTGAFMILGGKLGVRFGSLAVFRAAILAYCIGLAGVALSGRAEMVIASEAVIGLGAACLVPSLIGLIAAHYRGQQQVLAIGILAAAAGIGTSVALIVGGIAGALAGWRLPFWILLALALAVLILSRQMSSTEKVPGLEIDWVGAALSAAGIGLVTLGINSLGAWGVLAATPGAPFTAFGLSPAPVSIAAGLILAWVFFSRQSRLVALHRVPLLSPQVLDSRVKRSAALAQMLGVGIHASILFLLPLHTQIVRGTTPFGSTLKMLPYTLSVFAASILVTRLLSLLAVRRLARSAFALIAIGVLIYGIALDRGWSDLVFVVGLVAVGLGAGAANTVVSNIMVASSPRSLAGEAGGVRGTANNVGGAIGTAISGVVLAAAVAAALSGGVAASPAIRDVTKDRIAASHIGFVSDKQFANAFSGVDATREELAEATRLNGAARLQALRYSFFALVGMAALAFLLVGSMPEALPQQD